MHAPSASRRSLSLEIGKGHKMDCDLRRHLSPRTVGLILRSVPLSGTMHRMAGGWNIVYMTTSIDSGLERARTEFQKGDIAFLPSAGSICFFLNDTSFPRRMTPIGKLGGDVGLLASAGPGTVLSITKNDE